MKAQNATPEVQFRQQFSATPRGARLARRLAAHQLHEWGFPHASGPSETVQSIVAELAANAVTHGRVPGRDFALVLVWSGELLRIEVADACGERSPEGGAALPGELSEGGRGLWIVAALADAWGVLDRQIGKIVWAEVSGMKGWVEE